MKFKLNDTTIKLDFLLFVLICTCLLFDRYDVFYVIIFSVLHEFGHLIWLVIFDQKIESISITYYGIGIKFINRLSPFKEFIYLLGGLLVNFIFLMLSVEKEINFALLFINVLPIYPLDGGRILKLILNSFFKLDLSYKIFKTISVICLVTIFLFGIMIKNISLIVISAYSFVYCFNDSYD